MLGWILFVILVVVIVGLMFRAELTEYEAELWMKLAMASDEKFRIDQNYDEWQSRENVLTAIGERVSKRKFKRFVDELNLGGYIDES